MLLILEIYFMKQRKDLSMVLYLYTYTKQRYYLRLCFSSLTQGRADSKRYPAIDPLESYSKYLEYPEIEEYLDLSLIHI